MTKVKNNFFNVVYALFLREIQTRFGSRKMGYFWAIVEPSAFIIAFASVKIFLFNRLMQGVDYSVFLASSIIIFLLFRNIMMKSISSFEANRALFIYAQVKPIHTIISRILVEFLISSIISSLFIFIAWYFNYDLTIKNMLMVLISIIWIQLFAFGLGLIFALINNIFETFNKILKILLLPLMVTSAVFYSLDSLPSTLRNIILYNPIAHFMELMHGNFFLSLDTQYVDYKYMTYWTIIPLFLGLYFYLKSERKIQST